MLRISLSGLKPGVTLGKDIFSSNAQLLLPGGTVITQEHLDNFRSRNVFEVYINEAAPPSRSGKKFDDVFDDSLNVVKSFMLEAKLGKPLEFNEISDSTDLLVEQVFDARDLFRQMRLMKDKDDYLFTHSVNVALLSILLGRWLGCDKDTIKELGEAGLVHDVGKVFVPDYILNKPGKLSPEEFEEMKKHSLMGYNLLIQNEEISHNIANAALMHHERADGTGYPMGRTGYDNGLCVNVVAVADLYDAVTSTRVYSTKRSPYTAAEILWQESFGKLDPRVAKVFYDKVTNFYVGNQVLLSNNETGIVVFVDPTIPTRPMVMVGDKFYDLSRDRSITVLEIVD